MKIEFKLTTAHGASNFKYAAGTDELRPLMHGAIIDFQRKKLYVTNAHIIVAYKIECDEKTTQEPISIPLNVFEKKNYGFVNTKQIPMDWFKFSFDTETQIVDVFVDGVEHSIYRDKIIEGKVPNCNAIFPKKEDANPVDKIGLNLFLLEKIRKAVKLPGDSDNFTFNLFKANKIVLLEQEGSEIIAGIMPVHLVND